MSITLKGLGIHINPPENSWPSDRWTVTYGSEGMLQHWSDEDKLAFGRFFASVECRQHGHVRCPCVPDCCDGTECIECGEIIRDT